MSKETPKEKFDLKVFRKELDDKLQAFLVLQDPFRHDNLTKGDSEEAYIERLDLIETTFQELVDFCKNALKESNKVDRMWIYNIIISMMHEKYEDGKLKLFESTQAKFLARLMSDEDADHYVPPSIDETRGQVASL